MYNNMNDPRLMAGSLKLGLIQATGPVQMCGWWMRNRPTAVAHCSAAQLEHLDAFYETRLDELIGPATPKWMQDEQGFTSDPEIAADE